MREYKPQNQAYLIQIPALLQASSVTCRSSHSFVKSGSRQGNMTGVAEIALNVPCKPGAFNHFPQFLDLESGASKVFLESSWED